MDSGIPPGLPQDFAAAGRIPLAVVVVDGDGLVSHWSTGARRLFGHAREAAIGQPASDLMPGRRSPRRGRTGGGPRHLRRVRRPGTGAAHPGLLSHRGPREALRSRAWQARCAVVGVSTDRPGAGAPPRTGRGRGPVPVGRRGSREGGHGRPADLPGLRPAHRTPGLRRAGPAAAGHPAEHGPGRVQPHCRPGPRTGLSGTGVQSSGAGCRHPRLGCAASDGRTRGHLCRPVRRTRGSPGGRRCPAPNSTSNTPPCARGWSS